jgi:hypothetical protein
VSSQDIEKAKNQEEIVNLVKDIEASLKRIKEIYHVS